MIEFLPNKTVALTMKDEYELRDFVRCLLNNGYTVSQSESTKEGCVKIYVSDNIKRNEDTYEIC